MKAMVPVLRQRELPELRPLAKEILDSIIASLREISRYFSICPSVTATLTTIIFKVKVTDI